MFVKISDLIGRSVTGLDGRLGVASDFLIDQKTWHVRWVVLETGPWLFGREALIPPSSLKHDPDGSTVLAAALSREAVQDLPGIGTDLPVCRQTEVDDRLFPKPVSALPGVPGRPSAPERADVGADWDPNWGSTRTGDPDLRSAGELTGYDVNATDGHIGTLSGLMLDTNSWRVRMAIVATGRWWWPGRRVYCDPNLIENINWLARTVIVGAAPIHNNTRSVAAMAANDGCQKTRTERRIAHPRGASLQLGRLSR